MPIAGITDGTGAVLGQAGRDYSQVSKLDFMTLLVAQIKNQDPTSPMDNAQFTSQITQFSMLEQLETMSQSLEDNVAVGTAINNTAMLALVGRKVTVEGNDVAMSGGAASESMIAASSGIHKDIPAGFVGGGAPPLPIKDWMRVEAVKIKLPEMRTQLHKLAKNVEQLEEKIKKSGEIS